MAYHHPRLPLRAAFGLSVSPGAAVGLQVQGAVQLPGVRARRAEPGPGCFHSRKPAEASVLETPPSICPVTTNVPYAWGNVSGLCSV